VVFALGGCRFRTEYRSDVTTACMAEAAATYDAHRASPDPGSLDANALCKACCHRRGLDDVDPGACTCGKVGLDALLK
jgi:hypothetical protein